MKHRVLVVLLALLWSCAGARAADAPWWNNAWRCRRTVGVPATVGKEERVCSVLFRTARYLRKDAADVRVISRGREVPHRVVFVGPGSLCHIVIPVPAGMRRCEIYYGNPKAGRPEYGWTPKAGLILETRRYTGGPVQNLSLIRQTIERSKPAYGADFVKQVFHGFNPFGPATNFTAAYTGWIECPRDGQYLFATMAGGPSFLAIDGKPVASRPHWGGPSGRARFRGRVRLTKGLHAFEYYMVHRYGRPVAVAAWQPPGAKKVEVIPPDAFPGVLRGKLLSYEVRGQDVAPDFSWSVEGEALLRDGTPLVRMRFRDETPEAAATGYTRRWEFGDGLTATERVPTHLFLRTGKTWITLRVSLKGRRYSCTHLVPVDRPWAAQAKKKPEKLADYAEIVRKYPFKDLEATALSRALRVLAETEDWRTFAAAAAEMLKPGRLEKLPERWLAETALLVGGAFRKEIGDPDGAVRLFRRAEAAVASPQRKADMAFQVGDTYFYYIGDVAKAKAEYARLIRAYPNADRMRRREAFIRLGDAWAQEGKYDEAKDAYEKAQAIRLTGPSRETFGIGARAFETEAFLRRKEYEAAHNALMAWQWEHPADKLVGEWSVLMGKWALATRRYDEALRCLRQLHRVNPRSPYVPEALMLAADCYEAQNQPAKAIGVLETLRKDYPESPLVKEAGARLERLAERVQRRRPRRR